jgi:hypothetical protein
VSDPLPGGDLVLAVGDVVGHGLAAAATMVRLRHATAALAVAGHQPTIPARERHGNPRFLGLRPGLPAAHPAPTASDDGSDIVKSHLTGRQMRGLRNAAMLVAAAAALLIATSAAAGTRAATKHPSLANQLRTIEQKRTKALVAADIATARRFMARDYRGIDPGGDTSSRAQLLGAVKAGVLDFLVDKPISRISVRQFGNAAVLVYRRSFDLTLAGTRLTHKAWSTELYERRQVRWQIVLEQTTAVPNNPDLFLDSLKPTS